MMKTTTTIILILIAILGYGQKSTIDNHELLVKKEYSNEIYDVNPLFSYASIYVPRKSDLDLSRDSLSQISAFTPDINISIKPIAYKTLQQESGKKGFVKLDKGTINPIHAQAGYSYNATNYFNINGRFKYDNRQEKEVKNKSVKTINVTSDMEYYLNNEVKSTLSIDYNRQNMGLYRRNQNVSATEAINNNIFTNVSVALGMQTFKSSPAKWNFGVNTKISNWQNNMSDDTERDIKLNSKIEYRIDNTWSMSLTPRYQNTNSNTLGSADVITGSYQIAVNTTQVYSKIGLRVDYLYKDPKLWPVADIRWNLGKDTHINIRSQANTNIWSARSITTINPYQAIDEITIKDNDISYLKKISADVSSAVTGDVLLKFFSSYLKIENDLNFITSNEDERLFKYDLVGYERLRMGIDVQKNILDGLFKGGIKLQYDKYAKATEKLYYRPTFTVAGTASANLLNSKLNLTLTASLNNPQDLDRIPNTNLRSGWRNNLSFALSYRVHDQASINFNADNIFDDEYQVWKGYDNFGRNLSGGLVFKF